MDDALNELVSRFLDGDLDDADKAALGNSLVDDPELAAELEARRRLRSAVAVVGSRMEPPATLDRVMEPLRRSAPAPTPRVRPLYRVLAVAAAVVLGVTVTLEVARRHPGPTPSTAPRQRSAPVSGDNEVFELAPLPTANPNEDRPFGAVDRLLDEHPPDPAPPELPPLDVIGPLADDDAETVREDRIEVEVSQKADGLRLGSSSVRDSTARRQEIDAAGSPTRIAAEVRSEAAAPSGLASSHHLGAAPAADPRILEKSAGRVGTIRAAVTIAGVEVWVGNAETCSTGARKIEIVVDGGQVTGVVAAAGKTESGASSLLCVPPGLIGSALPGVSDGNHHGDLVIGASAP